MSAGTKPVDDLRAANQTLLRQGIALLSQLDDASYIRTVEPLFSFGVGCHIRHCLDAYACFLQGVAVGLIDYDTRVRNGRIETDRSYALFQLEAMTVALQQLARPDMPATILARQDGNTLATTSPEREWQYLMSHTVHHFALIAVMLRAQGYTLSTQFGVAPSTLAYWGKQSSCAAPLEIEVLCAR